MEFIQETDENFHQQNRDSDVKNTHIHEQQIKSHTETTIKENMIESLYKDLKFVK